MTPIGVSDSQVSDLTALAATANLLSLWFLEAIQELVGVSAH